MKNTYLPQVTVSQIRNIFAISWAGNFQLAKLREWLYRNAGVWLERKRDKFYSMTNKMEQGKSKYRGVTWEKTKQKWQARCCVGGKRTHLGFFDNDTAAAIIYNQYISAQYLPKARLNVIDNA